MPASPSMALISVAPPMRNDFAPNSDASMPSVAAISRARSRDSVVVHVLPSIAVKRGVALGRPNVLSPTGTLATPSSQTARSASYGQSGSAPTVPPRCLRRIGIGVAFCRASVSLMGTT
eukprot:2241677-Pleurochrysis_carterae.AAC.2